MVQYANRHTAVLYYAAAKVERKQKYSTVGGMEGLLCRIRGPHGLQQAACTSATDIANVLVITSCVF